MARRQRARGRDAARVRRTVPDGTHPNRGMAERHRPDPREQVRGRSPLVLQRAQRTRTRTEKSLRRHVPGCLQARRGTAREKLERATTHGQRPVRHGLRQRLVKRRRGSIQQRHAHAVQGRFGRPQSHRRQDHSHDPQHQRLQKRTGTRRLAQSHRSKPVGGGGPRLLQGNQVRLPRLGQGTACPSGNLRILVRGRRGPAGPSDHRETVRTLQFMGPEDVQTVGRDGRHGRPGTVEEQAERVDARPPGRTGRHGPVEEPAIPARTARAGAARPAHPRRHHREARLRVDPDRSDPRLHDRHVRTQHPTQHHRRRYEEPYGQP